MNQQINNMLKNLITQHKADFKLFLDQVDAHVASEISDFTKLNNYINSLIENQNMMRSLLCRLWAKP